LVLHTSLQSADNSTSSRTTYMGYSLGSHIVKHPAIALWIVCPNYWFSFPIHSFSS